MSKVYIVIKYMVYEAEWIVTVSHYYTTALKIYNKIVKDLPDQHGVELKCIPLNEEFEFLDKRIKALHHVENREGEIIDCMERFKDE